MPLRVFSIPCHDDGTAAETVNHFTAAVRVVTIERRLIEDGQRSFWAVCVDYFAGPQSRPPKPGKDKIDYREILPDAEFAVYAKLRTLRKQLAEGEGVPAYSLFTNEQLAAMIRARVSTVEALKALPGVGDARIEKYATAFPRQHHWLPLRPSSRPDGGAGPEQTPARAIPPGLAKAKGGRRAGRTGRSPSERSPAGRPRHRSLVRVLA